MQYSIHVKVRRQLCGVSSLLLPSGFWGLNSGCQAWQKEPLRSKPCHHSMGGILEDDTQDTHTHTEEDTSLMILSFTEDSLPVQTLYLKDY